MKKILRIHDCSPDKKDFFLMKTIKSEYPFYNSLPLMQKIEFNYELTFLPF